ncbi:MAG TPA: hypothetical protein VMJ49_01520 [Gaiellaceae bacterium]|nr:hypothetical protein [Gaiellaceae bacterium]
MDERYPIGETDSVSVAVIRHDGREVGYTQWTAAIGLRGREATVHIPGHYPGVLAQRLRKADEMFRPGAKLPAGRDEYLDLTALVREDEETLALSSSSRLPVRVTLEVPRGELAELAAILDRAQELIEELRQGIGLVPDALPDSL